MAIDSAGMMRDVFRLADDSMRGRRVGTPEDAKARDFVAARFDAIGLDRIGPGRIQPFSAAGRGSVINGFNVVGTIQGSSNPDEYIVISAHFDHIGAVGAGSSCRRAAPTRSATAPTTTRRGLPRCLPWPECLRARSRSHTLVFVAFDAEESGDVGSHAWVEAAPIALSKILVDVNMDMVGRNVKNQLYAAGPGKYPQLRAAGRGHDAVQWGHADHRARRHPGTGR